MSLSRLFLALPVVALALALPATAGAAKRAKPVNPVTTAVAIGHHYWGAVPCGGQLRVLARQRLAPGLHPTTDAWVTFDTPLGANNLDAPASTYTNCTIALARWRWPRDASMRADWDILCTTVTHELGHLLGRHHDATPGSIMAPVFTDYSSVPRICKANRPARLARHR